MVKRLSKASWRYTNIHEAWEIRTRIRARRLELGIAP
jgi:hypothetical protein